MQADELRQPPNDLDAEACALSALMLAGDDRELFDKTRRLVWKEAFYSDDNRAILDAIDVLRAAGKSLDAVILRGELIRRGVFEEVGGNAYLAKLLNTLPSAAHGPTYAATVAAMAMQRDAIKACQALVDRLMSPIGFSEPRELIRRVSNQLEKISMIGRDVQIWTIAEAVEDFMDTRKNGEACWAETGVATLDRDYQGVTRWGGYTLIAARPSMGKSTFCRDLLRGRAHAGFTCGLIAVEENRDKIAGNYISAESNVENSRVAYAYDKWASWERDEIGLAIDRIKPLPIYATDTAFTLSDVMSAAEMLVSKHKCRIIAIDHIHLIGGVRAESREQQISEISGAFKEFVKRRNVVGIMCAQLNRPERTLCPPPPALTDLRGSGALEEHADAVLMLHREDYYYRGRDDFIPNGLCQIHIRKNRNGCVGEIVMKADLAHQRFEESEEPIPSFD